MSSTDETDDERRSLTSGRQKKLKAKTTFTYKVGNPSYGALSEKPVKTEKVKLKGGKGMTRTDSMTHCHENVVRSPDSNTKARKTLIIASVLCLFFMIVEVVGGYIAGSLAIMTDAAHLLSDFASFMISLVSLFLASRPATRRMSFGWHRAEVIGAVVSVLMIWVLTGILVYVAIERIISKNYEIEATIMVITASVGVAVNLIMGIVLHRGGHAHSHGGGGAKHGHGHSHGGGSDHGHSHSHNGGQEDKHSHNSAGSYQTSQAPIDHVYTQSDGNWIEIGAPDHGPRPAASTEILLTDDDLEDGRKKWFRVPWRRKGPKKVTNVNINVRAALIHVIGDFVQSIGILLAALIIYFRPDLAIMDPICTFIFSILVLITTINVIRDALNVLMEGLPRGMSFSEVAVALQSLNGVIKVHDLRIWSLTMDKVALSVHLAVDEEQDTQDILREATQMLRERFRVYECTVQIEHYSNAMDECKSCENPDR